MIVLASVVTNEVLSIKKQHILPVCKDYFDERERFIDARARIIAGERLEQPLQLQANFISIPPPSIPVEALRNKAYSAKRIPGRSIALVSAIDQYFFLFSHSLESRTEQIRVIRANRLAGGGLVDVYFGLDSQKGGIDSTYLDIMRAIQLYADDVAFFGVELVADLEAYTARLYEILKKISSDVPKRTTADFSEARDSGLLPPRENYESWLKGFPATES